MAGSLDTAMSTLQVDAHRTLVSESVLQSDETITVATLAELATARQSADAAVGQDNAVLGGLNNNLLALVAAANERRAAAAEQEKEEQLAEEAQQAAAQAATSGAPAPSAQASPGTYSNPFRSTRGLYPERIDQGVDFGGFGPVFAVGDGVVLSTVSGGWPGGTFISYRLTDGPANGLVVYVAEGLEPTVQVGQSVNANTVVGQMYGSWGGIETGWADDRGEGTTLAADQGEYGGGSSTAFGYNFSQFLESLGAPGGHLEGGIAGSLPAGWPHW